MNKENIVVIIKVKEVNAKGLWHYQVGQEAIVKYNKTGPVRKAVQSLTLMALWPTRVKVLFADGTTETVGAVGTPVMWKEMDDA